MGFVAFATASPVEAKTPGQTYCFNGICHRVKTLAETSRMVGRTEWANTSFYDSCKRDSYNPCGLTSSGEVFRPDRPDNAASPIYPNGTKLLVFHPGSKRTLVVRVNNAGPYWGKRTLDLSRAAADRLGIGGAGVASLQVKVLAAPSRAEATYQKHRTYAAVPGYVGVFKSIETAFSEFGRALGSLFASPAQAAPKPAAPPAATTRVASAPKPATPVKPAVAAKPAPSAPAATKVAAKPPPVKTAHAAAPAKPAIEKATSRSLIVTAAKPAEKSPPGGGRFARP